MENQPNARLKAKAFYSGFPHAHDTYLALSRASDGKIYYILSSEKHDEGGKFYVFDPTNEEISLLADLTEACGEKDLSAIAQGKSHVEFYEAEGKLFFATHIGYYEMIDGMERLPENAPDGQALYPGGHFLSYDMENGKIGDLGIMPYGEGVLSMAMDALRKQILAISWPSGYLVHLDVSTGKIQNLGLTSQKGEAGKVGEDYRVLCRSILNDPSTGKFYFSTAEGDIYCFDPLKGGSLSKLEDVNLRLDYFGSYNPTQPGSMGYNWRKVIWNEKEGVAYGVHGNSGYLFRFDTEMQTLELVERLTSLPSRKSGMFDQFSYGYLGFQLGPDGETIYYLTGGPIYQEGKRLVSEKQIAKGGAKGLENLHLITYHIPSGSYADHGPIFYPDESIPTYVNSIAIDFQGAVYALARMQTEFGEIQDLIQITAE
ncbi:MAG TPA: hypothetical protein VK957_14600 [Lunatimonas sp.]|nr:hypothetical protein [Lunatimonas sp.]